MTFEPFRPQAYIACPECAEDAFAFSSGRYPEGNIWYECIKYHRTTLAEYLRSSPDASSSAPARAVTPAAEIPESANLAVVVEIGDRPVETV